MSVNTIDVTTPGTDLLGGKIPIELKVEVFKLLPSPIMIYNLMRTSRLFKGVFDENKVTIIKKVMERTAEWEPGTLKLAVMAVEARSVDYNNEESLKSFFADFMNCNELPTRVYTLKNVSAILSLVNAAGRICDAKHESTSYLRGGLYATGWFRDTWYRVESKSEYHRRLQALLTNETAANLFDAGEGRPHASQEQLEELIRTGSTLLLDQQMHWRKTGPWRINFWQHFSASEIILTRVAVKQLYELIQAAPGTAWDWSYTRRFHGFRVGGPVDGGPIYNHRCISPSLGIEEIAKMIDPDHDPDHCERCWNRTFSMGLADIARSDLDYLMDFRKKEPVDRADGYGKVSSIGFFKDPDALESIVGSWRDFNLVNYDKWEQYFASASVLSDPRVRIAGTMPWLDKSTIQHLRSIESFH